MTRLPVINAALCAHRSHLERLIVALAAVAAATLIRLALSPIAPNLTFVTYYPAVLICTLLTGWRYGAACALVCGLVANGLFLKQGELTPASIAALVSLAVFLASCAVIIATASSLRWTVQELAKERESARLLNLELQHRVGNMLAIVQALATKSASENPDAFVEAFTGRLKALASAHRLLAHPVLETCELSSLITEACKPFSDGENISLSGPLCLVPPASCVPLVLAFHELCTNATKYGALSVSGGRVNISWLFDEGACEAIVTWQERGGPPVTPPTRKGLGSRLLQPQSGIPKAVLEYLAEGVRCRLNISGTSAP